MPFARLRRSKSCPGLGLAVLAVCAVGFSALPGAAPAQASAQSPIPVAVAARIEKGPREQTRLIFLVNACVAADTYVLDNPDRAIVDLPEINFQIDPSDGQKAPRAGKPRGKGQKAERPAEGADLIASYRFGRLAAGKSRIVIDLAGPAELLSTSCAPTRAGTFELSLALAPQAEAAFKAAARAGAEKQAQAAAPPPRVSRRGGGSGSGARTDRRARSRPWRHRFRGAGPPSRRGKGRRARIRQGAGCEIARRRPLPGGHDPQRRHFRASGRARAHRAKTRRRAVRLAARRHAGRRRRRGSDRLHSVRAGVRPRGRPHRRA